MADLQKGANAMSMTDEEKKAKRREYSKAKYHANPEKARARQNAWYAANKEKVRERQKAYYDANREKLLKYSKACRVANPEVYRAYDQRHRAVERGTKNITLTAAEQQSILGRSAHCFYCERSWEEAGAPELEHVIPISIGGYHVKENCVAACKRCNRKKAATLINPHTGELIPYLGGGVPAWTAA